MNQPKDVPNFAAWSNKNLADFCTEAYMRMQEMQEENEHLKLDAKAALEAARHMIKQQG
jgi:hypothetical protein